MRLLALLASVVIATPAVADEGDLTMREDPTTKRHYFLDPDRLVSDVMIGWAFTAEAGKDVDYARAEYDGEYLLQQVGDGSNVVNVLVDTKSDRIIADLDNEKAAYEACWAAGGSATNHCDISVEYSSSTRLAIVVLDSKWYTNAVRLYRLRPFRTGLRVQASADLLPAITHDTKSRLAQEHRREPAFQRDGMSLVYAFRAPSSRLVSDKKGAFEIHIQLEASAYIPKGGEHTFSAEGEAMHYRVRGDAKRKALAIELR
jgi:hypothetical protein